MAAVRGPQCGAVRGRASVRPADWHVERNGEYAWPVECVHAQTRAPMQLAIGIDAVWTPSGRRRADQRACAAQPLPPDPLARVPVLR